VIVVQSKIDKEVDANWAHESLCVLTHKRGQTVKVLESDSVRVEEGFGCRGDHSRNNFLYFTEVLEIEERLMAETAVT